MSLSVIEHRNTVPPDLGRTPFPEPIERRTEVIAEGCLDATTLPGFVLAVGEALSAGARVELDLSGIHFLSIAAAAYIGREASLDGERRIEITSASWPVAHTLAVTGLGALIRS